MFYTDHITDYMTKPKKNLGVKKNLEKPCLSFKLYSNQVKAYLRKKPLTQYNIFSITFICRLCTMLLSYILLVTLYAINNNKSVHSKSATIVPKTTMILRNKPKQRNLNTLDKLGQNITSKQKGQNISSDQGILSIIFYFLGINI